MARHIQDFQTIHSEGGLLPPDLLRRVLDPKEKVPGTQPEDYGLPQGERINETITQSWNRLRRHWAEFREAAKSLPQGEPGTGLTNDKWSVPLLRELGFGMLPTSPGPEINGRTYAINRFFGPTAIHLVGCGLSLDRRAAGVRGAAAANPHGLVQEFLNRSEGHLWAIVSNGLRFRVLRDNQALSRQSYLEFDLESMFSGELFSDFVLLWLMVHATRFAAREEGKPESCWLEQWTKIAAEQGTRALESLRGGVEKALQVLGQGFVGHPRNTVLREALRTGQISLVDFHGQLLRVVYRLIFLFVAEDRTLDGISLLHPRDDSEEGRQRRERYAAHYSTARLRDLASHIKGSRHGDLWQQFNLLVGALSGEERFAAAREHLALPVLGSFLWSPGSTNTLNAASLTGGEGTELANADFLEALRNLAFTRQNKMLRPVDYKNLGAEELGGVYESLLALTPQISGDGARFNFAEFAGNKRKTSGSYYTPDSLVQCLLDSALEPVVEEAIKGKSGTAAEKALLSLKVCDPAVGSGHFLVGAAHRLARHLARIRASAQGESEPSPLLYQHALRDVIGRCLYGVDINPMAAELCRVSLWLEALEPGKPLSFLDHHIRVGNSLLGGTPELIASGLPEDAFTAIEGDDKKACAVLKRRNRAEREGLGPLFAQQDAETQARLQQAASILEELPDDRPEDIRVKELAFRRHEQTEEYRHKKQLADAWCAAFIIKKYFREVGRESSVSGITQRHLNDLAAGRSLTTNLADEAKLVSEQHQFFHWHLAFPEVFAKGGFDCILGNPPWERTALEELEFFASRSEAVLNAPTTASRKQVIQKLKQTNLSLYEDFLDAKRTSDFENAFFSGSGLYPLGARGRLNTYALFANLGLDRLSSTGRFGMIVQTGIATDAPMEDFWRFLVDERRLVSLIDFENKRRLFNDVHPEQKFSLLTFCGHASPKGASVRVGFWLQAVEDIGDAAKVYELDLSALAIISPNTTQPILTRHRSDLEVVLRIYANSAICWETRNGSGVARAWVGMTSAAFSEYCKREEDLPNALRVPKQRFLSASDEYWPLIEGKQIGQFDHAFASYDGVSRDDIRNGNPREVVHSAELPIQIPCPRFWALGTIVNEFLASKDVNGGWTLCYRDVTNVNNERTAIGTAIPATGMLQPLNGITCADRRVATHVLAAINSFPFDFVARLRFTGRHLNVTTFSQMPIPSRQWDEVILARVIELTYTGWDLEPFAKDCCWTGPPFRWDDERRFLLRCELDAAFFHLYLPADINGNWRLAGGETSADLARLEASFPVPRDAVDYIMDTFPIVKRKDEAAHGHYRTKDTILKIYDAMQRAIATGQPYQTLLDPAPGPPCDAQGNFISIYLLDRDNWPTHIHPVHPDWEESLLATWFGVCQKRWTHLYDDQIFPWDGREALVYALIPYLVQEKPGEKFEFYRDAALLASRSDRCETLLLDDALRAEYRQAIDSLDWLQFPDTHRIRPRAIREALQNKHLIQTDAKTGATTLVDVHRLPPLPPELKPLLPLILKAADNLDRLQRRALEDAEAAKVAFTYDEVSKEFTAMSVA